MCKKNAFTLAEVLITIGVIGVVAAMTIPNMLSHYRKVSVVNKLKHFYSTMNSAVKMSIIENGDVANWEGANFQDGETTYNWWMTYLDKYFQNKNSYRANNGVAVDMGNGSAFHIYNPCKEGRMCAHFVFCTSKAVCDKKRAKIGGRVGGTDIDGKSIFLFILRDNNFETYYSQPNRQTVKNLRDKLINETAGSGYGCANASKAYCAALIQYDGWRIADDYPNKI